MLEVGPGVTALRAGDWVIPADAGLGEFILGTPTCKASAPGIFGVLEPLGGAQTCPESKPMVRLSCRDFGGSGAKAQLSKGTVCAGCGQSRELLHLQQLHLMELIVPHNGEQNSIRGCWEREAGVGAHLVLCETNPNETVWDN